MADKSKKRRQRILEKSAERMAKLEQMKSAVRNLESNEPTENKEDENEDIADKRTVVKLIKKEEPEETTNATCCDNPPQSNSDSENVIEDESATRSENPQKSKKHRENEDDLKKKAVSETDTENSPPTPEGPAAASELPRESWWLRKRRLLVIVILAWVVYAVVEKNADVFLAYVFSHRLSTDALQTVIFTAFLGVELQLVLADIFVNTQTPTAGLSKLLLVVQLCGVRPSVVNFFQRFFDVCSAVVTDFCVYVFCLVCLRLSDGKVG